MHLIRSYYSYIDISKHDIIFSSLPPQLNTMDLYIGLETLYEYVLYEIYLSIMVFLNLQSSLVVQKFDKFLKSTVCVSIFTEKV